MKNAIAIAAHPDDIELTMVGTLLLLKKAGYEIHYMNLSGGNCGSTEFEIFKWQTAGKQRFICMGGALPDMGRNCHGL
jgi:LmbE family N-acetylglucosaminyl deacetylase